MVRRLTEGNLFCRQNHFSYEEVSHQLIVVHQERHRLTLSRRRPISYRNQSIDLQSKSMDCFLYDIGLRHERVKLLEFIQSVGGTHMQL